MIKLRTEKSGPRFDHHWATALGLRLALTLACSMVGGLSCSAQESGTTDTDLAPRSLAEAQPDSVSSDLVRFVKMSSSEVEPAGAIDGLGSNGAARTDAVSSDMTARLSRETSDLEQETLPSGAVRMKLAGRFNHVTIARQLPDGSAETRCVSDVRGVPAELGGEGSWQGGKQ